MDIWSTARKIAETARDVLTEEQLENSMTQVDDVSAPQELREAWDDIDRLTKLCEQLRAQMSAKQEEESLLRSELSQIKAQLRRSELERDEAKKEREEENKRLRLDIESLSRQLLAGKAAASHEGDAQQLRLEIESLSRQLSEERAAKVAASRRDGDAQQLRLEIESLSRQLSEERAAKVAASRRDGDAQQLRLEIESLSRQLSAAKEAASHEGDAQQMRLETESLSQQLLSMRESEANLRRQVESLSKQQHESNNLRLQVESLSQQLLLQQEANTAVQRELVAARDREQLTQAKGDLMRSHLVEREEELDQLTQTLAETKMTLEEALNEIAEISELKRSIEEKDRLIFRTEKALGNLEEAVSQMAEDHRSELTRREKLLREKFNDEFAAKLAARERELQAASLAMTSKCEMLELEMGRVISALGEKEKKIDGLLNEISPLREALADTMKRLTEAIDKDQFSVDKRLMANLVVAYFTSEKKHEVLKLLLRILDIPKPQREKIYGATRGWFGGSGGFDDDDDRGGADETKSLGDMWIEYLLKEAGANEESIQQQQLQK